MKKSEIHEFLCLCPLQCPFFSPPSGSASDFLPLLIPVSTIRNRHRTAKGNKDSGADPLGSASPQF